MSGKQEGFTIDASPFLSLTGCSEVMCSSWPLWESRGKAEQSAALSRAAKVSSAACCTLAPFLPSLLLPCDHTSNRAWHCIFILGPLPTESRLGYPAVCPLDVSPYAFVRGDFHQDSTITPKGSSQPQCKPLETIMDRYGLLSLTSLQKAVDSAHETNFTMLLSGCVTELKSSRREFE